MTFVHIVTTCLIWSIWSHDVYVRAWQIIQIIKNKIIERSHFELSRKDKLNQTDYDRLMWHASFLHIPTITRYFSSRRTIARLSRHFSFSQTMQASWSTQLLCRALQPCVWVTWEYICWCTPQWKSKALGHPSWWCRPFAEERWRGHKALAFERKLKEGPAESKGFCGSMISPAIFLNHTAASSLLRLNGK